MGGRVAASRGGLGGLLTIHAPFCFDNGFRRSDVHPNSVEANTEDPAHGDRFVPDLVEREGATGSAVELERAAAGGRFLSSLFDCLDKVRIVLGPQPLERTA